MDYKKLSKIADALLQEQIADNATDRKINNRCVEILSTQFDDAKQTLQELHSKFRLFQGNNNPYAIFKPVVCQWLATKKFTLSDTRIIKRIEHWFASMKSYNDESFETIIAHENDFFASHNSNAVKPEYDIIPIHSFTESLKYISIAPEWCIFYDEGTYDYHTMNGKCPFYFCIRKDAERIEAPIKSEELLEMHKPEIKKAPNKFHASRYIAFDTYGLSALAISIKPDGTIYSSTDRYDFTDRLFKSLDEMQRITGIDTSKLVHFEHDEQISDSFDSSISLSTATFEEKEQLVRNGKCLEELATDTDPKVRAMVAKSIPISWDNLAILNELKQDTDASVREAAEYHYEHKLNALQTRSK